MASAHETAPTAVSGMPQAQKQGGPGKASLAPHPAGYSYATAWGRPYPFQAEASKRWPGWEDASSPP